MCRTYSTFDWSWYLKSGDKRSLLMTFYPFRLLISVPPPMLLGHQQPNSVSVEQHVSFLSPALRSHVLRKIDSPPHNGIRTKPCGSTVAILTTRKIKEILVVIGPSPIYRVFGLKIKWFLIRLCQYVAISSAFVWVKFTKKKHSYLAMFVSPMYSFFYRWQKFIISWFSNHGSDVSVQHKPTA